MMQRSRSPPRRMRACVPCTKARARCHFQPRNAQRHLCDRCERLGIGCEAKTTAGLRRPRRIKDDARIGVNPGESFELPTLTETHGPPIPERPAAAAQPSQPDSFTTTPATSVSDTNSFPPCGLSWYQANRILNIFRETFMPSFPFVLIDEATSAQQLSEQNPMLFRAVLFVSSPLPEPRVDKLRREALGYVGQQLLAEEERTLDILQGLLICIARLANVCVWNEQITELSHLALGCANSLGLTKIPLPLLRKLGKTQKTPGDVRSTYQMNNTPQPTHSLEQQRAFLGCYYVLAMNSVHLGRRNALNGHAYIDICCDALLEAREYPTDFFLERSIRMTQMGDTIAEAFGSPHFSSQDRRSQESRIAFIETDSRRFRQDLDRLMESLSDEQLRVQVQHTSLASRNDVEVRKSFFTMNYHYLVARLNEPAMDIHPTSELRRLRLRNCLLAVRNYCDVLLTLPKEALLTPPPLTFEQGTFSMILASKMAGLEAEASNWDNAELVKQTFDLVDVAEKVAAFCEEVEGAQRTMVEDFVRKMGIQVTREEMDVRGHMHHTSENMRKLKGWLGRKLADGNHTDGDGGGNANGDVTSWLDVPVELTLRNGGTKGHEMITGAGWFGGLLGSMAWNFDNMDM